MGSVVKWRVEQGVQGLDVARREINEEERIRELSGEISNERRGLLQKRDFDKSR